MPKRPCLDCGRLCTGTRCRSCTSAANRARDQRRGSRHQRGYGASHEAERERWRPLVDRGGADCAEPICLMPTRRIAAGQPWDLAHTDDRLSYRGPAHALCNRAAAGRASHQT